MQDDKGVTGMLMFSIFSAVLGMFQFGYNTGVINAPQKILEEFIANIYKSRTGFWITEELRDLIWSLTVSVFAIGGMIGGISGGAVANWCGRKTGLVLNNSIAILGATLMSSSHLIQSIECLILGRFFIGINCGLNTALVPMYLSEISTLNLRGALGTVSQLGVTIGLLLSQVLGLKQILGTKEGWPFLFGVAFIPALLQLLMLPFCPESPRYLLISRGRVREARQALKLLRNCADVEEDMEEMRAEDQAQQSESKISMLQLIKSTSLRTPLIIGIVMQLSQQLSGINAIFYYSTDVFLSAEVPEDYAVYCTIGVGVVMVLMTLISILLMDRLGRRTLHLYGLAGMFLASIFLTISLLVKFLYEWMKYLSVASILGYVLFFAVGPGPIPWMITSELFSQGPRPAAMSIAVLVNWSTNFAVGLAFPMMKRALQNYLFLPFTAFLAIFWIFTYHKVPETKNRTFEEVATLFKPVQMTSTPTNYGSKGPPDGPLTTKFTATNVVSPGVGVDAITVPADHSIIEGQRMVSHETGLPIDNVAINGNIIMANTSRCVAHHHEPTAIIPIDYTDNNSSTTMLLSHRPVNQYSSQPAHSSNDSSAMTGTVSSAGLSGHLTNTTNAHHLHTCRMGQHEAGHVDLPAHFYYQDTEGHSLVKPRTHAQLNHVHPVTFDSITIGSRQNHTLCNSYPCKTDQQFVPPPPLLQSTRPQCNNSTFVPTRHVNISSQDTITTDGQSQALISHHDGCSSPNLRFIDTTTSMYQTGGNNINANSSYYVTTAQSNVNAKLPLPNQL